jgi:hypothetical protein
LLSSFSLSLLNIVFFLVQLGVCKRMSKEVKYYEKEVEENTMKVQRMRDNNQDIYDIKKQVSDPDDLM